MTFYPERKNSKLVAKPGWPMLLSDDYSSRRAGFAHSELRIMQYRRERAGAGSIPTTSRGGEGLPERTKATHSDEVLWYTLGFHHATVPKD
jgi:Cu2+-containing amine oxidase